MKSVVIKSVSMVFYWKKSRHLLMSIKIIVFVLLIENNQLSIRIRDDYFKKFVLYFLLKHFVVVIFRWVMTRKTITPSPVVQIMFQYIFFLGGGCHLTIIVVIFGWFILLNAPVFPRKCLENNIAYGHICLAFSVILWHALCCRFRNCFFLSTRSFSHWIR